jgi:rare lipoprotein A
MLCMGENMLAATPTFLGQDQTIALANTPVPGKTIPTLFVILLLTGCGTLPDRDNFSPGNDGPPLNTIDISAVSDAEPRLEPRSQYGNPESYVIRGKRYHVKASSTDFKQHGIASWYGTKFHGRKTSSGEPYDMFTMTAAHKTLPLPTWVEVINNDNQKRIVVKVNDRGPFISGRIIDLSYAAAVKLGVFATGTANVTISAIDPAQYLATKNQQTPATMVSAPVVAQSSPDISALALTTPQPVLTSATKPAPSITALATNVERASTKMPPPELAANNAPPAINGFYLQVAAFSNLSNAEQLRQRLLPLESGDIQIAPDQQSGQAMYRVRIGPLANLSDAGRIAAHITSLGLGEPRILLD